MPVPSVLNASRGAGSLSGSKTGVPMPAPVVRGPVKAALPTALGRGSLKTTSPRATSPRAVAASGSSSSSSYALSSGPSSLAHGQKILAPSWMLPLQPQTQRTISPRATAERASSPRTASPRATSPRTTAALGSSSSSSYAFSPGPSSLGHGQQTLAPQTLPLQPQTQTAPPEQQSRRSGDSVNS